MIFDHPYNTEYLRMRMIFELKLATRISALYGLWFWQSSGLTPPTAAVPGLEDMSVKTSSLAEAHRPAPSEATAS